jgi:hypothetical protein
METQICLTMQKCNLQKILQKKPQSFKIYYNSIINFKFQTQAKIPSFKNPHIKIDRHYFYYYLGGQNPLSYYNSIMNLNTISFAFLVGKANEMTGLYSK